MEPYVMYRTRNFISVFTIPTSPNHFRITLFLILSFPLQLCLPKVPFSSDFPQKFCILFPSEVNYAKISLKVLHAVGLISFEALFSLILQILFKAWMYGVVIAFIRNSSAYLCMRLCRYGCWTREELEVEVTRCPRVELALGCDIASLLPVRCRNTLDGMYTHMAMSSVILHELKSG